MLRKEILALPKAGKNILRGCLHVAWGRQVGEVSRNESLHLSCQHEILYRQAGYLTFLGSPLPCPPPIKAEQKNTSLEDALIHFNQKEEFPPAVTRAEYTERAVFPPFS